MISSSAWPAAISARLLLPPPRRCRRHQRNLGDLPILAAADTRGICIFSRTVDDRLFTFDFTDGLLTDRETGTIWNPFSGAATAGPLAGRRLAQIPHTAFI